MSKTAPRGAGPRAAAPAPSDPGLHLPHERDEGARREAVAPELRGRMRQAERDVEAQQVDTEARGTPSDVPSGTDAPRRRGR